TGFSYTAALAIVFWYTAGAARRLHGLWRLGWVLEGAVVSTALLASGGRGGLVAAIAAIIVLPLVAGHPATTLKIGAASCLALAAASWLGLSILTFSRLLPQVRDPRVAVVDQYGSGRLDLLRSNLGLARRNIVLGAGFDAAGISGFGAGQATNTVGRQAVA